MNQNYEGEMTKPFDDSLSTEKILANMLKAYGIDLLQNQQRISDMISDLFAHDHKTKRMLLLSISENIPTQLTAITDRDTQILAIQNRLTDEAFLKEDIAEKIVSLWTRALGWITEEPDNTFEIIWERGYCGFKNDKGIMITDYKYNRVFNFSEGLALVESNGKFGFIDKLGKEIIPLIYDKAKSFSEGLAIVVLNSKYGFIDKLGKEIIPLIYDKAKSFSEGLALVELNHKHPLFFKPKKDFIDKLGREVIPLVKYNDVYSFKEGLARVEANGDLLINKVKKLLH